MEFSEDVYTDELIKVVVVDDHAIGLISPEDTNRVEILATNMCDGHTLNPTHLYSTAQRKIKLATEDDLSDYQYNWYNIINSPDKYQLKE